jgi:hypothetical protein
MAKTEHQDATVSSLGPSWVSEYPSPAEALRLAGSLWQELERALFVQGVPGRALNDSRLPVSSIASTGWPTWMF